MCNEGFNYAGGGREYSGCDNRTELLSRFFWYSYNIDIPELHSNNGLQTAGAIKLYVDRAARWMPFCAYLCDEQYMRQMSSF